MDAFLVGCYLSTKNKVDILRESIYRMREVHIPIVLVSHLPAPEEIVQMVDYFIYDGNDGLSEDYTIYYHYDVPGCVRLKSPRGAPYHSLSCLRSIKNGAAFMTGKFENVHFLECDCLVRFNNYINLARNKLEQYKFVGIDYHVPKQYLSGIMTNFFSFKPGWFNDRVPNLETWAEFRDLGKNRWDYLMFENWMHNHFSVNDMLKDCYFMNPEESLMSIEDLNIEVPGGVEPAIRPWISETENNEIILFVHLHGGKPLDLVISQQDRYYVPLKDGTVHWRTFPKTGGTITVESVLQKFEFEIDPEKTYADTLFKFDDGVIKCLRQENW
jgi:hypothetical protein